MTDRVDAVRRRLLCAVEHATLGLEAELWVVFTRAGRSLGASDAERRDPDAGREERRGGER